MRESLFRVWALVALALLSAAPRALAEERTDAQLEAALCSPLDGVRRSALFALSQNPPRALPLARTWIAHERPDLREQAWHLLGRIGEGQDVPAALAAVCKETEGPVAAAAASAAVSVAGRHLSPEGPWLKPGDPLAPRHRRVFALALTPLLRQSTDVPQAVMHLGEGCVPWLLQAYRAAPDEQRVRDAVVRSLGRLASDEARRALAGLVSDMNSMDRVTWFNALRACGKGPGLDPVHELIAHLADEPRHRRGRSDWPRQRAWRRRSVREALYRFIAEYPDDRWADRVRERMRGVVSVVTGWNVSLVVRASRALLVLGDPTDDDISLIVDAGASPPWPRPDPGRFEGLGDVFRALRGYKAREALQRELEGRDGAAVPRTSRAWIALLSDEGSEADARAQANALLLDEPPLAPCLRAGARILDAVGGPSAEIVRTFVTHGDPYLRAWALKWAPKTLPEAESTFAVRAAGRDDHDGVAVVAAERMTGVEKDDALIKRLVRVAAFHASPSLRSRAWRVLERVLRAGTPAGESTPSEEVLPRGAAPMDERLRGVAKVRVLLRAKSQIEDLDEALPDPADEGK